MKKEAVVFFPCRKHSEKSMQLVVVSLNSGFFWEESFYYYLYLNFSIIMQCDLNACMVLGQIAFRKDIELTTALGQII